MGAAGHCQEVTCLCVRGGGAGCEDDVCFCYGVGQWEEHSLGSIPQQWHLCHASPLCHPSASTSKTCRHARTRVRNKGYHLALASHAICMEHGRCRLHHQHVTKCHHHCWYPLTTYTLCGLARPGPPGRGAGAASVRPGPAILRGRAQPAAGAAAPRPAGPYAGRGAADLGAHAAGPAAVDSSSSSSSARQRRALSCPARRCRPGGGGGWRRQDMTREGQKSLLPLPSATWRNGRTRGYQPAFGAACIHI